MSQLKYAQAEVEMTPILEQHPEHPEVLFVCGKLHHRLGDDVLASDFYERALHHGNADARPWLRLIRFQEAMTGSVPSTISIGGQREEVNPASYDDHVQLARQFHDCGWAGRALMTLERANERFPQQSRIQRPLADLYRSFAMPEPALTLYEQILARNPGDSEAKHGKQLVQSMLIEPAMSPLTQPVDGDVSPHNSGIKLSNR